MDEEAQRQHMLEFTATDEKMQIVKDTEIQPLSERSDITEVMQEPLGEASTNPIGNGINSLSMGEATSLKFNLHANGLGQNGDLETDDFQQTEKIQEPLGEASTNPIGNDTNSVNTGESTPLSFNLNTNNSGDNLNSEISISQQSVFVDAEFLYFLWAYKAIVFGLLQKFIVNITSAICLGLGFYICNHFIFPFLDKLIYRGNKNTKDK